MDITASQILESAPRRFRPEKASNVTSTFHFIITGDENFGYTINIADGKCTLAKELIGTPSCTITTKAKTYIELETGKANPQMALMMGKVKISNIGEMMQFAKCFRRFDESYLVTTDDGPQTTENTHTIKTRSPRKGPLEGVTVIDFTRLLPGPLATQMLADMGADVIKVEDPDSPDYIRSFEPMIDGTSAFYYALNRNKRSLAVNFLSPEGKQIITDLVKKADVFIEQYRPGVMKNFGLDYESLKQINPRIIYVSITGYGQESSKSQAAGHDLNYISIAGMLSVTGDANGYPIIPGFQLADIAGGSYMAVNAVTAALYKREKTQTGEWLDVAMTDSVLPFMALPFAEHQATGAKHPRGKFQLAGGQANYNIYKCADGKFIALGSLEPKFWNAVCKRLGKPEWQEKIIGGVDIQASIQKELQQIFLAQTREEWIKFFATDDICLTPINEIDELTTDTYLRERK
ncbi:MAG: Carnitine dehydratase, partial [Bacteroidetes bacterium]|nr:Carnitine dehydratase [Bacteroidota bacterium]